MFTDALTELAALSVSGVNANYAIDAVPETIHRGQLPVLLVLPIDIDATRSQRLFPERGGGFETLGFSDGVRTVTYSVTHLLLLTPATTGRGLRDHLPGLVALIDAYFSALAVAVTLGGRLVEPAHVRVDPGTFTHNDVAYIGCAFRHTWVVQI